MSAYVSVGDGVGVPVGEEAGERNLCKRIWV